MLLYIQVFTFMHMGGTQERMEVRMIGDASQLLTEGFNVAKAQCFKGEDRQKILAVIESAFGDIRRFDREVRSMLDTKFIEAAHEQRRRMKKIITWIRRPRTTVQKLYACPSTETKGDCTASNEVRPFSPE